MGVEGDVKCGVCGDLGQDVAMGLLVLKTICVHIGVSMREKGGGWWMFLAEADSNHASFLRLFKVLLPAKGEKVEKIDRSPVITRNYSHA